MITKNKILKFGIIPTTYTDGTQANVPVGTWIKPVRHGYILECCDCSLKHRLDFRVRRGRVEFRAWRVIT